ncbi:MAG: antibiotic biosynthesis monooxygenase [Spirochaetaceae bacterium]|nr:antibiotic biosynthesis monooxygenase [Spirochaetaceae bacterium]
MIVYSVSVLVKTGFESNFIKATKINHKETRKEKGNMRFDVLQSDENPCLFELYEVYRSEEAVMAHKETRHYKDWRDTVAPWMARDRKGVKYAALYPKADEEW